MNKRDPNRLRKVEWETYRCQYITDSGWKVHKRNGNAAWGIWWQVVSPQGKEFTADNLAEAQEYVRDYEADETK